MKARDHASKLMVLVTMVLIYAVIATTILLLVNTNIIKREPFVPDLPDTGTDTDDIPAYMKTGDALAAATAYVEQNLHKPNGHIDLYQQLHAQQNITQHNHTNSEAVSYYLQAAAQQGDKKRFDSELSFVEGHMMHPEGSYMMWHLDDTDAAEGEGRNIAPDADLRALHALYIAKDRWGDARYDTMIDRLATGLERVALSDDNLLIGYGGMSGEKPWRGDAAYLAYSDFQVYDRLANTRGGRWPAVASQMRNITLKAQIWNGLYNSEYRAGDKYGNGIDGGKYSINSLWIMVRFAESNDRTLKESARKSLVFYQDQYSKRDMIYDAYTSSGEPATTSESPWNYALIARAASALGERSFAQIMERRMLNLQDDNLLSPYYGAFPEGAKGDERVGQFTMHEAILTMQQMEGIVSRIN
jgi:endo-1,4-beta-D-glucanase Y